MGPTMRRSAPFLGACLLLLSVQGLSATLEHATDTIPLAPSEHPVWLYNVDVAGVALSGFDVIGYHEGEARVGLRHFSVVHQGVAYWFSSAERRDRFAADPERWVPVCGGWDALMCGVNQELAGFAQTRWRPTPGAFRVHDGRLLMLSERPEFNTLLGFDNAQSQDSVLIRADAFWADRMTRARRIGQLPEGMDPLARLELEDWFPLLGRWRCEGWVNPPNQPSRSIGTADWTWGFGYGGHTIQDHWMPHDNPSSSGPASRIYDPVNQEWGMIFMPSQGPSASWWRMIGHWRDGELHGEFTANEGQIQGRLRFYNIQPERFSWISDRSFDGGETWLTDYQQTECTRAVRSAG